MNGGVSPSGDRHPGEVVLDNAVDDSQRTEKAENLPQTIAWARDEAGAWVAVTRIETRGTRDRREVTKFGAEGQFLETTVQSPPRPPPRGRPQPPPDLPQRERP